MSLKKSLMKQGMKLMSDPRVMKLMQDERVMKAVMTAMSLPGKVQHIAQEQVEKAAKVMQLATEDEVKDLRRTVRKLEDEVARLQREKDHAANGKARASSAESTKAT
jgi:hypothetical protein